MTNIFDTHIVYDHIECDERLAFCLNHGVSGYICSINSNILVEIFRNDNYKLVINSSLFNFCDGSIVCLCSNFLLNQTFKPLPGPELFIKYISKSEFNHCIMGSTQDVLSSIFDKFDRGNIFCVDLPFLDVEHFDYENIALNLSLKNVDFVWVSLGAPKQEIFSFMLSKYLKKGVIIPVGAAFNYSIDTPPLFFLRFKLLWLFRIYKEPKKTLYRLFNEILFMPIILVKQVYRCIF